MREIIIVGLGPGDRRLLTVEALEVLQEAGTLYLRTRHHPVVESLPATATIHTFDPIYDAGANFDQVYATIARHLLSLAGAILPPLSDDDALAQKGFDLERVAPAPTDPATPIVYAVPGHPNVGETSVRVLRRMADELGVTTRLVDGLSFIEPLCAALGLDPLNDSLSIIDATEMAAQPERFLPHERGLELPITRPLIISQLYNQRLAGAVKLALMDYYPDEYTVTLVRAAGVRGQEQTTTLALYELDHPTQLIDHLTALYVPPIAIQDAAGVFAGVQWIVARLRAPGGCPWDREQTHESLKRYLVEETYEVLHAIDTAPETLHEELGDVLLQVLLHAQLAAEADDFSIADVMATLQRKLIRRHPHVFGEVKVSGAGEVVRNWEQIKKAEKQAETNEFVPVLAGVPIAMPALQQAQAIQRKAGQMGFDWQNADQAFAKIGEELDEMRVAPDDQNFFEEVGDVLSTIADYARWRGVDAEDALRYANQKFRRRFGIVEKLAHERGIELTKTDVPGLVALWNEAKAIGG